MSPALQGLITIILGVGGCIAYFYLSNIILDKVIFPPHRGDAGRNISRANMVRPWLFLAPALAALGLYLAYPVVETLRLSLTQRVAIPGAGGSSAMNGWALPITARWPARRNSGKPCATT